MTLRLGAFAAGVTIAAFAVLSCGGGGNGKSTPVPSGLPTSETTPGRPATFEELRDGLANDLNGIGVSICCLPDDIQQHLLDQCRDLELYADAADVSPICDALLRAMQRGDPGLIDLILPDLRALKAS